MVGGYTEDLTNHRTVKIGGWALAWGWALARDNMVHLYYLLTFLQPVVMATKESVVVMERPRPHSTVLDRQATQVFETLAKKLHRLESRGMLKIRNSCMLYK